MVIRIGIGYDVHRLAENRPLVLGGVIIPYHLGLIGHSDADVLTHAIIDALLGAAKMGDIGMLYPDTDMKYHNINSLCLLSDVGLRLKSGGYTVINIDSIIIAQAPKLRPFIPDMEKNTAQALGTDISCISVKATTEEGLGFTGDGLGIAAKAVCLIQKG